MFKFMTMKNILFVFLLTMFFTGVNAQQVWYVSPHGDDENDGSLDEPLATVQAAMGKASEGDTICLREGVYREKVDVTKNHLTVKAYPGESPVMKGSVVMSGWYNWKSCWKKYVDVQPQQVFVDGNHPLQQIGYPNDWFKNQTSYSVYNNPVGEGLEDMAPGRFWWQNDTLYIWLEDSTDPNDHQIEVSQYEYILSTYNVHDVYIKGITFEHSNGNTFRNQATAVKLGNNNTLDSCVVQWCDFGGVSTGYYKSGARILNSSILHNGAVGISSSETHGFLIKNTRMAYNNYRNFYSQWHTGGYKGATYSYGTIEDCEVDNNNGPGIWFDYCMYSARYDAVDGDNFYPIIVRNNYLHNNGTGNYDRNSINNNASILIEVSEQAFVYNNVIDTFEYRGVWVSGSYWTTVTNNLLAHGTGYYTVDAGAIYVSSPPAYLKENRIVNNIFYQNETDFELRMLKENGTSVFGNVCRNNVYFRQDGSIRIRYGSLTITSLDNWRNTTPYGEMSIKDDPLFANNLFHLSEQSPCINTGFNLLRDTMTVDYEGNPRIAGPLIDMGPYEATVGGADGYNAALQSLTVDNGTLEPAFVPDRFVYYDTLPDNTKTVPVVTAIPAYAGATVTVDAATDVMSDDEHDRTTVVTVTSENGQVVYRYSVLFYSRNTTAVKSVDEERWQVYPNPTAGKIYVDPPRDKNASITVTDMSGRRLFLHCLDTGEESVMLDLTGYPEGLYLVIISSDKMRRTFKVNIKK